MDFHGQLSVYTVDSFSSVPFSGNPAAVCLDSTNEGMPNSLLEKIAAEMNLSETAFVRRLSGKDNFDNAARFGLRWFTPTVEVVLCGHATLAAAAVLFNCVGNRADTLEFETLSGTLSARRSESGIALDFPADPPQLLQDENEFADLVKITAPAEMVQEVLYAPHDSFLLVRLKDGCLTREGFEKLAVPVENLKSAYKGSRLIAVMITMKGCHGNGCVDDKGVAYDFVSRVFAPWAGIPEDPATGAAHTILGPYWAELLGKDTLYARQCSRRGGELTVGVKRAEGRVDLSGPATVVLRGSITI